MKRVDNNFAEKFLNETGLVKSQLSRLITLEKRLTRYNENECSLELSDLQRKVQYKNQCDAELEVRYILETSRGVRNVLFNTDPRGPAIRIKMTSGWYNCPDETLAIDLDI